MKQLDNNNGWTNINDQLPKENIEVLIEDSDGDIYVGKLQIEDKEKYFVEIHDFNIIEALFWFPIHKR